MKALLGEKPISLRPIVIPVIVVFTGLLFNHLHAQCPDYSVRGPYSWTYREADIPSEDETMNDCRIFYPAVGDTVPGHPDDTIPNALVPCPIVVFGHGFFLDIDRYFSYAKHLTSRGYVIILPTISNPILFPNHDYRARLMITAGHYVAGLNRTTGDIFENKLAADNWAFIGHSMGGSISLLAGDRYVNYPDSVYHLMDTLRAIISFCSPQSDPAANDAHITTPTMILCGTRDNVVPWNETRNAFWLDQPEPGVFAVIAGANHCQFCDYYGGCDEFDGSPDISREEQKTIARRHLTAFLEYYQRGDTSACPYLYAYGDSIQESPVMDSVEVRFTPLEIEQAAIYPKEYEVWVYPNPFNESTTIVLDFGSSANAQHHPSGRITAPSGSAVQIYDINGRLVFLSPVSGGKAGFDVFEKGKGQFTWTPDPNLGSGVYLIKATNSNFSINKRIVYLK